MRTNLGKPMAFALALFAPSVASAQQWPFGEPSWYYTGSSQVVWSAGWTSGWLPLLMLCFLVAAGIGVYLAIHAMHGHASHRAKEGEAHETHAHRRHALWRSR
jgi:formate-dependent nitrite reductase membrane component NrfD